MTPRLPVNRTAVAFYVMVALLAVLSMWVLFRLGQRFEGTLNQRIADLQRVFSSTDLLRSPGEAKFSFAALEAEVRKYQHRGEFGGITLTKAFSDGSERAVYPFYLPAVMQTAENDNATILNGHPMPGRGGKDVRALPLVVDNVRLGTLWVEVKQGAVNTVRSVIAAMAAMLGASLFLIAMQFRRQERVISRTSVELEEKRRELVRLERLSLAGQLAANVLHDLKKPVLNIKNEADELIGEGEGAAPPEPDENLFHRIREQTDLFFGILRESGLDRFVKAQDEREFVNINELVQRSLALVRYEQRHVEVQASYGPDVPVIFAEPVRLIQVFSNIILNGYQAMDGRGTFAVTTAAGADSVVVKLSDNGPGIPADTLPRIFDPFYTTKEAGSGTGLGLYICSDIVKSLDGRLTVSTGSGGTTFTVTLPATPEV